MEPTLIAVTLLSLGMAVAMSIVAWRLLREERRRSAARVARLAELAAGEERPDTPAAARTRPAPAALDLPLRAPDPRSAAPARTVAPADPLDRPLRRTSAVPRTPAAEPVPIVDDLFAAVEPSSAGGHRVLVLALAATLVVAIVTALVWLGGARATDEGRVSAARMAPLELVALRHTKQNDTLTIAGLVQNPKDGRDLAHVTVVAFVFDQAGEFIASGRAELEFSKLTPGAESPFQITIANAGNVGRYRIGFRTEDGGVLGHVDRRPSASAGQPERASADARVRLAAPVVPLR